MTDEEELSDAQVLASCLADIYEFKLVLLMSFEMLRNRSMMQIHQKLHNELQDTKLCAVP